jgi:hypothetical protein
LSGQEVQFLYWTLLVALIFISITIALPALIKITNRWRLYSKIKCLGNDSIHHVNLPDGLGGSLFYEYIILSHEGLSIYNIARYRGNVFAADTIEVWTQVENNRSYKFPNPLLELESKKVALVAQLPDIPISTGLLIPKKVIFPKGKPESVHILNTLLPVTTEMVNPGYLETWGKLKKMALPLSENEKKIYLDLEETRSYWGRLMISMIFLVLAVIVFLSNTLIY